MDRQPSTRAIDGPPCGVALEGRLGQAYDEKAFQYFLEVERKRSARSGRPFLLLLVEFKKPPKEKLDMDPNVATTLLTGLALSLRETDVMGWYRECRVVGAVLPQVTGGPRPEGSRLVRQRVVKALREGFSPDVARRFQVHVYQLRPTSQD